MCWWTCHWCQHGLDVIDATTLLKMLKKPSWGWWRPTNWSWSPHTLRCVIWCFWSPTACTWCRPWWNCTLEDVLQALEVIVALEEGWWWCMVSLVVKWLDETPLAYGGLGLEPTHMEELLDTLDDMMVLRWRHGKKDLTMKNMALGHLLVLDDDQAHLEHDTNLFEEAHVRPPKSAPSKY